MTKHNASHIWKWMLRFVTSKELTRFYWKRIIMWINWNVFEEFWVWICLLCWSHCAQSIQEIVLLHLSPTTYFVGMRTSIMVFKWCNESPFKHHQMSYCETMRRGIMWKWQMFVKWNFLQSVCIEKLFLFPFSGCEYHQKVPQFYLANIHFCWVNRHHTKQSVPFWHISPTDTDTMACPNS
jgi:hypothetical protein